MPLYEYQCGRCGRFELIRRFSDAPLSGCPTCGGEVHKLFSAPAIQFKGSGWYITDYARKSGGEGTAKPAEGSKDAKTDTSTPPSNSSKDGAASGSSPSK